MFVCIHSKLPGKRDIVSVQEIAIFPFVIRHNSNYSRGDKPVRGLMNISDIKHKA
jgi:hypothetical protein